MGKNIENLPTDDRPYEKLEMLGSENLSNSELLAIIIKTGTRRLNCVEVAQNILKGKENTSNISDLEYINSLSIQELQKYEGIGRVKSIQIRAVIEIAKRLARTRGSKNQAKIVSPKDAYELIHESYIDKKQEIIKTILLNKANKVISIVTNSLGNLNTTNASVKEIFCEPIKQMAAGVILVHNHPSGNTKPSNADINFTKFMCENGRIFGIQILDHIVISNSEYTSMSELGYIDVKM